MGRLNWTTVVRRLVEALGAVAAIVSLYVARDEIGRFWHRGYPQLQLWTLTAIAVGEGIALVVASSARASNPQLQANDRRLFEQFERLLPSRSPAVRFLQRQDFGATFKLDQTAPLNEFLQEWADAEHRFRDRRVERARTEFLSALEAFLMSLSREAAPVGSAAGWYGVAEPDELEDFRLRPDSPVREVVERLNAQATDAWRKHQEFMATGRRRLSATET